MKKVAVFASGAGSNAINLFEDSQKDQMNCYKIQLLITNKENAGVIAKCKLMGIPCFLWKREHFYDSTILLEFLKNNEIDYVVLAGFLLKIPIDLIQKYPNKIINIHPSLLPKYGGKGMYGDFVHKEVLANSEKKSGITIHYVNENYDEGQIIFQKEIELNVSESLESLRSKIHQLEHQYFPAIIRKVFVEN